MNENLLGMVKGQYLPANNPSNATSTPTTKPTPNTGATSTTGGSNVSGSK